MRPLPNILITLITRQLTESSAIEMFSRQSSDNTDREMPITAHENIPPAATDDEHPVPEVVRHQITELEDWMERIRLEGTQPSAEGNTKEESEPDWLGAGWEASGWGSECSPPTSSWDWGYIPIPTLPYTSIEENEPDEDTRDEDESSEVGQAITRDRELLAYGEIPFKKLARPEKFSNDFFEVKKSPIGGNGVFAKRDLKEGEIILVERPLFTGTPDDIYDIVDGLAPELRRAYLRMAAHKRHPDQDIREAILFTNCFSVGGGSAVYLIAARFNHACRPINTVDYWLREGDVLEFRMRSSVPAGTELTISYGTMPPKSLFIMWGFRCACGGCKSLTKEEAANISHLYCLG
ncbi:hypothetical protein GGR54DRAFT_615183, partial [Hypoxylon sp. NC1633]